MTPLPMYRMRHPHRPAVIDWHENKAHSRRGVCVCVCVCEKACSLHCGAVCVPVCVVLCLFAICVAEQTTALFDCAAFLSKKKKCGHQSSQSRLYRDLHFLPAVSSPYFQSFIRTTILREMKFMELCLCVLKCHICCHMQNTPTPHPWIILCSFSQKKMRTPVILVYTYWDICISSCSLISALQSFICAAILREMKLHANLEPLSLSYTVSQPLCLLSWVLHLAKQSLQSPRGPTRRKERQNNFHNKREIRGALASCDCCVAFNICGNQINVL